MMKYKELMELGQDKVEHLCNLYDKEVISVPCHKNYTTGEIFYDAPVPENAVPVCWFSNSTHFLRCAGEFAKLTEKQLEQLGQFNNDKFRPPMWAFED